MIKEYKNVSYKAVKMINKTGIFEGYASVFNKVDSQGDVISPGAFKNLEASEIKILWQHNPEYPIGRVLEIYEDKYGLCLKAQLILSVKKAAEAYDLIKTGSIKGLSIGYKIIDSEVNNQKNIRILKEIELWEISVVTYPANMHAKVYDVKNLPPFIYESTWQKAINALTPY